MLDQPITQQEFADLVGVSQQAVSEWISEGLLERGAPCRAWLHAYCGRLREQAAGRDPTGELTSERARLAREQADRVAMENAVRRREFAPVGLLEVVLSHVARQVATRLDAVVPQLKRQHPDLPASVLADVAGAIVACRELCAAANIADADRLDHEDDADEEAPGGAG